MSAWSSLKSRLFRVVLLVSVFCLAPVFAQRLNFRIYRTNEGLPQTQVYSVNQDQNGYLWVATLSGAARYNGKTWQIFDKTNGLPRNQISVIETDRNGRVLLGTVGGGLSIYDQGTFQNFPEDSSLGSCEVTDLLVDGRERIWVASREGLMLMEGNRVTAFSTADGLPNQHCTALFERKDGSIWVATIFGVVRYSGGDWHSVGLNLPDGVYVTSMAEDRRGKLFFATTSGLFTLEKEGCVPVPSELNLKRYHFTDALLDYQGRIWFTSRTDGAVYVQSGQVEGVSEKNGLSHHIAHCIFMDRENNLWFGTDDGLAKLVDGPFMVYDSRHGLGDDFVRAVFQDRQNRIWLGTRNGVTTITGGKVEIQVKTGSLASPTVYSVAQHPNGNLLFGTHGGMTVYDPNRGSYRNFTSQNGLPLSNVRSIFVDSRSRIWLGGDGLYLWTDLGFMQPLNDPLISEVLVQDMAEDDEGRIWIATRNKGILVFETGERPLINYREQFDEAIWCVERDRKGRMWIGTNGLGLFSFENGEFKSYGRADGLTDDYIWQVLPASNGDVWVGHNMGLDRLRSGRFTNYNVSDGLAENETTATATLEDNQGRLWFGSGKGLTLYTPAKESGDSPPPMVHVEQVTASNGSSEKTIDSGAALDRDFNNLRFRFIGISFINENAVRYQYQLDGQDDGWSPVTGDTTINHNNLDKGEYRFLVKARNESGVWSAPTEFLFTIKPAFYETLWFRLGAVLFAFLLLVGYHRSRLKLMAKRNLVLEHLVEERTSELEEKNRELRELSLSDSLTKLRNRRFLVEMIPGEVEQLRRMRFNPPVDSGKMTHGMGFMMVDLDHFKAVNDVYGHDAGDRVLETMALAFSDSMRKTDVVARWGGEEFLIFLKELKPGKLGRMAKRILQKVSTTEFDVGGGTVIRKTCSIGYAYFPGYVDIDDISWEDIVKLADRALYLAKERGRNRAVGLGVNLNRTDTASAWFRRDIQEGIDEGVFIELNE